MQSIKSWIFYHVVKYRLSKLAQKNYSLPELRKMRDSESPRLFKLPQGLEAREDMVGNCSGAWLTPPGKVGDGCVLYLHGGAYVTGSVITHQGLAGHLAMAANVPTFIFNYRLAPEYPHPAALNDALAVFKGLHDANPGRPIAVAGDSAGGGLALALALALRDQGFQAPAALALMSPWTDLKLSSETHASKQAVDPFFPNPSRLRTSANQYADGQPLNDHSISPLFAELGKMPPTLIHVGGKEVLLDDSIQLAKRMQDQRSEVRIRIFPAMWHVWQVFVGRFKEADESIAELGAFLKSKLS
jgi:acetyl esterase/lipase